MILIIEIIVRAGANSCVLAALTYFQSKLCMKKTCPTSRYLIRINWHHNKCRKKYCVQKVLLVPAMWNEFEIIIFSFHCWWQQTLLSYAKCRGYLPFLISFYVVVRFQQFLGFLWCFWVLQKTVFPRRSLEEKNVFLSLRTSWLSSAKASFDWKGQWLPDVTLLFCLVFSFLSICLH